VAAFVRPFFNAPIASSHVDEEERHARSICSSVDNSACFILFPLLDRPPHSPARLAGRLRHICDLERASYQSLGGLGARQHCPRRGLAVHHGPVPHAMMEFETQLPKMTHFSRRRMEMSKGHLDSRIFSEQHATFSQVQSRACTPLAAGTRLRHSRQQEPVCGNRRRRDRWEG